MPKKQLAVYLRLSLEDTGANDESNSITAQRGIIAQFIQGQPELASMKTVEFVDDDHGGFAAAGNDPAKGGSESGEKGYFGRPCLEPLLDPVDRIVAGRLERRIRWRGGNGPGGSGFAGKRHHGVHHLQRHIGQKG